MMKRIIQNLGLGMLLLLILMACSRNTEPPINPFDAYADTLSLSPDDSELLPEASFARLHRDIFRPTCANAGCHDGHFEPDFRSIESSYNTLVFHPVLKNDGAGSFRFRVYPQELDSSVIWTRLNRDIDGQSGIMPLAVDPESDWTDKQAEYLEQIRKWILAGAPDVFGNVAIEESLAPYVQGLLGTLPGSSDVFERDGGNGAMMIPASVSTLQYWVSLFDEGQLSSEIQAEILFSRKADDFEDTRGLSLSTGDQKSDLDFEGKTALFNHNIRMRVDTFDLKESIFMQVKIHDNDTGRTIRIPGKESPDYIKEIFSFRRY